MDFPSLFIHIAQAAENAAPANQSVIGLFGLNGKLFIAQLVNFGIVFFVLWKWVFKPVAAGLAKRTEKIEQSLAEAQKITDDKLTFETWKQGEISTVRTEAAAIITQAKQEAEAVKLSIADKTKQEQERIINQAKTQIEQEKQNALQEIKSEVADMVVKATETIIGEKLDPKKDEALIKQALEKAKAK